MASFTIGRNGFTSLDDNYNGLPVRLWGTSGVTTDVRVDLRELSHTWPDDLDLMLIGPGNSNLIFMSDAGGNFNFPISNVTLSQNLPDGTQIVTGVYRPTAFDAAT